jgi:hypothetical protein
MLFKCFAFRRRDHERDHGLISLTSPGRGFLEKMIGKNDREAKRPMALACRGNIA